MLCVTLAIGTFTFKYFFFLGASGALGLRQELEGHVHRHPRHLGRPRVDFALRDLDDSSGRPDAHR